jgi:hypothetical protein
LIFLWGSASRGIANVPPKILFQFDTDASASTFDGVVAVDSGVDHLFRHGGITPANVTPLVHGAMFTRGGEALRSTAIFVGGSDVTAAESVFEKVKSCFFGPIRVSLMLDANGCNTTAAAAVVSAAKHVSLSGATVGVLGGTGPVGRRVAEMSALQGAHVLVASRTTAKALEAVQSVRNRLTAEFAEAGIEAVELPGADQARQLLSRCDAIIACGAAGVELVDAETLANAPDRLRVAIDLNAVPPAGLGGIGPMDKAKVQRGQVVYGAIGVGGLKMKIHRQCLCELFETNDRVLDTAEILSIAQKIASAN